MYHVFLFSANTSNCLHAKLFITVCLPSPLVCHINNRHRQESLWIRTSTYCSLFRLLILKLKQILLVYTRMYTALVLSGAEAHSLMMLVS